MVTPLHQYCRIATFLIIMQTAQRVTVFLLVISLNQDVMRRAQLEIDTVVGRDRLPYTAALMQEVSRYYTISFLGSH